MTEPLLQIKNAEVHYGVSQILFGLTFNVNKGQTMALLGRNGAGKSTTFKMIAGIAPPSHGEILLAGVLVSGRPPFRIARAGIGYVPEDRQVFPEHTVDDNLIVGAKKGVHGEDYWSRERIYEIFPILAEMKHRHAGLLSGGEQQMLTIARTLMGNPEVLLLDEPSEGLAPIIVQAIGALIKTLRGMGVTILLAEQNMHFCLDIATHATVIDKGQIVYSATIEALRDNADIKQRYLSV